VSAQETFDQANNAPIRAGHRIFLRANIRLRIFPIDENPFANMLSCINSPICPLKTLA
jgi:hypothetical protein